LRLGVDGWRLHGPLTGVGRYLSSVLRHWSRDAIAGRFEHVTLYTPAPVDRDAIALPDAIEERVVGPHWRKLLWENLRLGRVARDDVLFCPSYSRPLVAHGRTVVTIFEATQRLYPEHYPWQVRAVYSPLYGYGARRSAFVITASEAAADDITRMYHVARTRMRIVPIAPAEIFRPLDDPSVAAAVAARYLGAPAPYFLHVGKLTARRNAPVLLEAFAGLKRASDAPHKLLVVGLDTTGMDLARLAEDLGMAADFRHVEYVSDDDLAVLYGGAEAFVLPYTYEALSLTALEAQASGCPVITVDTPGLREQTGGHALFATRPDPAEIRDAMLRLAGDRALRRELVDAGLAHARRFTWERCALETLDVLHDAGAHALRSS
jgi:glycosyltransferase involved in cell wall biosynthesis